MLYKLTFLQSIDLRLDSHLECIGISSIVVLIVYLLIAAVVSGNRANFGVGFNGLALCLRETAFVHLFLQEVKFFMLDHTLSKVMSIVEQVLNGNWVKPVT